MPRLLSTAFFRARRAVSVRFYDPKVIDHFNRPRNVGSLNKKDRSVGTGIVGAPACGDVMKLQIEVDKSGKIVNAKFKTFGCGSAIASSSYLTEIVKGMTIEEASQINNKQISDYLKLPPVKLHCSMLAEDSIKKAIEDYQAKQQKKVPQKPKKKKKVQKSKSTKKNDKDSNK